MIRHVGLFGERLLPALATVLVTMLFLSIAATASAAPAGSAAPAASASSLPVDEIVERYVTARGGLKKIRSAYALRQTGRATAGANRTALVTRELKRPGRTRFEFTVQGVTAVYISDGREGWQVSPFDGDMAPMRLSDDAVAEAAEQADIEGPLVDWKAKGHQVELVGREAVGGQEAYKLKIILKSGGVRHECVDVRSFHLVRSDATRTVRGRPVEIRTTYGDFKKTGGLLFPRRIEVEAAGRPQRLSVVVDKIEVNPTLGDARFRLPTPVQP